MNEKLREAVEYWKDFNSESEINPIKGLHHIQTLIDLASRYLAIEGSGMVIEEKYFEETDSDSDHYTKAMWNACCQKQILLLMKNWNVLRIKDIQNTLCLMKCGQATEGCQLTCSKIAITLHSELMKGGK